MYGQHSSPETISMLSDFDAPAKHVIRLTIHWHCFFASIWVCYLANVHMKRTDVEDVVTDMLGIHMWAIVPQERQPCKAEKPIEVERTP